MSKEYAWFAFADFSRLTCILPIQTFFLLSYKWLINIKCFPQVSLIFIAWHETIFILPQLLRWWNAIKKEPQRRKDHLKEFSRGEICKLFCLLLIVKVRSETNDRNSFTFLFCAWVTMLVDFFMPRVRFLCERRSQLELFTYEMKKRFTVKYCAEKNWVIVRLFQQKQKKIVICCFFRKRCRW